MIWNRYSRRFAGLGSYNSCRSYTDGYYYEIIPIQNYIAEVQGGMYGLLENVRKRRRDFDGWEVKVSPSRVEELSWNEWQPILDSSYLRDCHMNDMHAFTAILSMLIHVHNLTVDRTAKSLNGFSKHCINGHVFMSGDHSCYSPQLECFTPSLSLCSPR